MKTLLTVAFLIVVIGATAQDGTIEFVRKKMPLGVLGDLNYFIDGTLVCRGENNTISKHSVAPGKHTLTVQYSGKESKDKQPIEINVQAGQTYVFKATIEKTNFTSKLLLEEIAQSGWTRLKEGLEQSNCK